MTLIITDKDIAVFEEIAKQRDIKALCHHCREIFPQWFEIMGEDAVLNVIYQTVEQAKKNQLTLKGSIQLYLDAVIILGSQFETDKQYQQFYLKNTNEIDKMLQLYEQLNQYMEQVIGEDDRFVKEMLLKMANITLPASYNDIEILTSFTQLYPQKVKFIGETAYLELIEESREHALSLYGFNHPEQQAIYLIIKFLLGQNFDTDIVFYWFNWPEIAKQIKQHSYTLDKLSKSLTQIVITGM